MTGTVILGFGPGGFGQRPGPPAGRLQPCPDSPNCVCSKSSDPRHRIAPIAYTGSGAEGKQKLVDVIRSLPGPGSCRTRVLTSMLPSCQPCSGLQTMWSFWWMRRKRSSTCVPPRGWATGPGREPQAGGGHPPNDGNPLTLGAQRRWRFWCDVPCSLQEAFKSPWRLSL